MTISIGAIDNSPARWDHPDDPDVWIEGVPLSYSMRRKAANKCKIKLEHDGEFARLDPVLIQALAVENGCRCFQAWGGIEDAPGKTVPCDRKNIQNLVDMESDILAPALEFFQKLFETRKEEREDGEKN